MGETEFNLTSSHLFFNKNSGTILSMVFLHSGYGGYFHESDLEK